MVISSRLPTQSPRLLHKINIFMYFRQHFEHLNTTRRPLLPDWRLLTFWGTRWKQVNSRGDLIVKTIHLTLTTNGVCMRSGEVVVSGCWRAAEEQQAWQTSWARTCRGGPERRPSGVCAQVDSHFHLRSVDPQIKPPSASRRSRFDVFIELRTPFNNKNKHLHEGTFTEDLKPAGADRGRTHVFMFSHVSDMASASPGRIRAARWVFSATSWRDRVGANLNMSSKKTESKLKFWI